MKQLLEFLPIALFFIVYQFDGEQIAIGGWEHQFDGIFSATAVLMGATALQVVIASAITRRLEKRLLLLLLAVLIFGGATLAFRNAAFIYWKPTIFNWAMALVFGASQFIGEKNLMERTLGKQIHVPRMVWTRLNLLAVAYGFSEEVWVSYKLYSAIGFTLLLTALTALIVSPYLKEGGDGEELQRDE